ncbi:MAG: hypothetical protein Q9226_006575 [Calogaya cf. arnoldii]
MHLLTPSILFSLFSLLLVGVVAPGVHKGDRCFRNENAIRTEDIKALAEDFNTRDVVHRQQIHDAPYRDLQHAGGGGVGADSKML